MSNLIIVPIIAAIASLHPAQDIDRKEAFCLAKNIYHESRSEGVMAQVRVGLTTYHTAERRGTSVCQEVYRHARYSWTFDKSKDINTDNPIEYQAWKHAVEISVLIHGGEDFGVKDIPTNFYEHKVLTPYWSVNQEVLYVGDNLTFTKDKGIWVALN